MGTKYNKAEVISEKMRELRAKAIKTKDARLEFLDKLWNRMRLDSKEDQLLADIARSACSAVNASASLLLLAGGNNQQLVFDMSSATGGSKYRRLPIEMQSDFTKWIMQNGKPMTVNDIDQSRLLYKSLDDVTGFTTKSIIGVPLKINGKISGTIEAFNKLDGTAFNRQDTRILTAIAATSVMALENARMNIRLMNSYKSTVNALVSLADAKETSGGGHSRRVSRYALLGASALFYTGETKGNIEYAAILHDIGKLSIPDNILNKAETPTDEEWELIRKHPQVGYDLLKDIPLLQEASKLILYHHERYDGNGYPCGLKGEDIPIGSRLIAVADAFDNMTTEHSYRIAFSGSQAFAELTRCTGTQFCPIAVKAFKDGFLKSRSVRR
jgi:HD-GYP domain-containing protein (c-di-GMP phosphodiesterase class II)